MGEPGAVGADQDPPGPGRLGQLAQSLIQDRDVVGGGVAAGPSGTQDPGQRLVRVVQEAQDRMHPEPAFEVRRRLLLLRMHLDQGGVDVHHHIVQVPPGGVGRRQHPPGLLGARQPGPLPRRRPGRPQPGQAPVVDAGQHPPRRRRRGDRPVQVRLIGQGGDVSDRLTAVGEHHRQIDQHLPRIVPTAAAADPISGGRVLRPQPGPLGQLPQQRGPGVRHDPRPVRGHHRPRTTPDYPSPRRCLSPDRPLDLSNPRIACVRGTFAVYAPRHAADHERSGLARNCLLRDQPPYEWTSEGWALRLTLILPHQMEGDEITRFVAERGGWYRGTCYALPAFLTT